MSEHSSTDNRFTSDLEEVLLGQSFITCDGIQRPEDIRDEAFINESTVQSLGVRIKHDGTSRR